MRGLRKNGGVAFGSYAFRLGGPSGGSDGPSSIGHGGLSAAGVRGGLNGASGELSGAAWRVFIV